MQDFELRQLRYLLAVIDAGQISAAASRLHIAQPAISQAISTLERQLGVSLLRRHPRGVEPTAAGRAFAAEAREVVSATEHAAEVARAWKEGKAGELRIGVVVSALPLFMEVISSFQEGHPEVQLATRQLDFATQGRALLRGEIDIELCCLPVPRGLVVECVQEWPRAVYLSSQHPLAGRSSLRFEDVADERQPGRHPEVSEEWADEMWMTARRGRRPPLTEATPLTPEEVWPLVASGEAITFSPRSPNLVPYATAGVVSIPLDDPEPVRLGVARREDDSRHLVLSFFDHVVETARETQPAPVVQ